MSEQKEKRQPGPELTRNLLVELQSLPYSFNMVSMAKLPSFLSLFNRNKEPVKYYVALKISRQNLSAASWQIQKGKVIIYRVDSAVIPDDAPDEFLPISDRVVSNVTAGLIPEPKDILFGIFPDWSVDGKIIEPHMSVLKNLCKELEFTPIGFVTIPEAIVNYLHEVENAPVTAILLGIELGQIFVTLVKAGKISGTQTVPITSGASVNQLTETALRQFTDTEILPSRILIYDGRSDLEKFREQILTYPWTQKLPFLHFPKVEIVETDAVVRAVAIAGGTQLGGKIGSEETTIAQQQMIAETRQLPQQNVPVVEEPDIEPSNPEGPSPIETVPEEQSNIEAADFGFFKDKDIAAPQTQPQPETNLEPATIPVTQTSSKILLPTIQISSVFKNFHLPKLTISARGPLIALLSFGVLLIACVIGFFVFLNFGSKAIITLYVLPKVLEKDQDITVITSGNINDGDAAITGSAIEVDETGSKRGVTTGKKLVGTNATGSITIYGTTIGRTFPAGTVVIGPNNLKFTLDSDVTIATGSAASQSTANANLTATGIGDSFNLGSGVLFSIADYPASSYQGKNDTAFSGGSSHQASVVAKVDQDRLVSTLSGELSAKALDDLKAKLSSSQNLLDNAVTSQVTKKKFDRDIDTEADSLTLNLTMHFTGVIFDQNNLKTLIAKLSASQIPSGYEFDSSKAAADVTNTTIDKAGNVILSVHFKADLLPALDKTNLTKRILGLKFAAAKQYLLTQNGVSGVDLSVTPKFLAGLQQLPKVEKNISLSIVSK